LLESLKESPTVVLWRKGKQWVRLHASRLRQHRFSTELQEERSETMLPLERGSIMGEDSSVEPEVPILVI
jgi:hypothetical protein